MRIYLLITSTDLNPPKVFSRLAKAKSWAVNHYPFVRDWTKAKKNFPQECPKWVASNGECGATIRSVPVEDK